MRRIQFTLAFGTALMMAGSAWAQVVGVATNPQGTLGYRTGIAVAKVVTAQTKIIARAQPMGGSTAYLPMVNRGEIVFGFTNAGELQHAFMGVGTFKGRPQSDLRVVGVMFPLRSGLAVIDDTGFKKIGDLKKAKGKRITYKYTSLAIIQDFMAASLANGGVNYDAFTKVPVSGLAKGVFALGAGRVDITWIPLGSGLARKVNTQLRNRGGIRYLDLDTDPKAVARLKKIVPGLELVRITNTKLPGIMGPTHIIEVPYILLTSKKTSDDIVYKVTKALAQNQSMLGKSMGAFKRNKRDLMGSVTLAPYHPGAIKAYKELGIKVGM